MFDDGWLARNGLLREEGRAETVGDLVRARGPRPLVAVGPGASAQEAAEVMQASGFSQLPVIEGGRAVGSVQEVTLARLLHDGADPRAVEVGAVMARPLPQVDVGVALGEAYRLLLAGNPGVLVTEGEAVTAIVTRIDLVNHWGRRRPVAVATGEGN